MRNPLPVQEIREVLGEKGFLRLYGQDTFLYVSDIPRRASAQALVSICQSFQERGFVTQVDSKNLLLIDLQPMQWNALLHSFGSAKQTTIPQNETLHGVYALARLLMRHPADLQEQPMEMIRAVFKQYSNEGKLQILAPVLHALCAKKLRNGQALPAALAQVLFTWLSQFH